MTSAFISQFDRFTASARRVVQRALREARRCTHDFVGTEHLLFGILCDTDGPGCVLLRVLNVKPDVMLQSVEESLQQNEDGLAMERIPLSPASRRVFKAADEEAANARQQMIGPEHLLLGLLCEPECVAAQILVTHGVTLNNARAAMIHLPPDTSPEAKIQTTGSAVTLGPNPSVDELNAWIAPVDKDQREVPAPPPPAPAEDEQRVERQLRWTQLFLGALLGYTFGYWLDGIGLGMALAVAGIVVAMTHNSVIGALLGLGCGSLFALAYVRDRPLWQCVAHILLAGFAGTFVGDFWRFGKKKGAQDGEESKTS